MYADYQKKEYCTLYSFNNVSRQELELIHEALHAYQTKHNPINNLIKTGLVREIENVRQAEKK